MSLKSQHKFVRNSLENLKQENNLVILVPKRKCHSLTAAVSSTQTRTSSRHTIARTQTSPLFYTLNVRRPGVESIAWSHFSTKHMCSSPLWDYGKWLEVGLLLHAWTCRCQGGSVFKYYSQVRQTALSQLRMTPGLIKETAMETFSCMYRNTSQKFHPK